MIPGIIVCLPVEDSVIWRVESVMNGAPEYFHGFQGASTDSRGSRTGTPAGAVTKEIFTGRTEKEDFTSRIERGTRMYCHGLYSSPVYQMRR